VNAAQALGRLLLIALIGGAGFWYGRQSVEPQPCDCGPAASEAASAPAAVESGPTQAAAASPAPPPEAVAAASAPQPLGCFRDTRPLDLDGHHARSANNTPLRCVAICADLGFAYAGLQYGESCLCGNQYGRYGTADNCNLPCTGNLNLNCGGYLANSVYSTGITPSAISADGLEAETAARPSGEPPAAAAPGTDPGPR
jgi:hypothetical protein